MDAAGHGGRRAAHRRVSGGERRAGRHDSGLLHPEHLRLRRSIHEPFRTRLQCAGVSAHAERGQSCCGGPGCGGLCVRGGACAAQAGEGLSARGGGRAAGRGPAAAVLLLGRDGAPVLRTGVCGPRAAGHDPAGRPGGKGQTAPGGGALCGGRAGDCAAVPVPVRRRAAAGREAGGHGADGLRRDHERGGESHAAGSDQP